MHEYDISLKLLLRASAKTILRDVAGVAVERWLDVEMPEMQNTRVDLLGETAAGELVHIELQSAYDANMPLRMLEYCVRIYRLFGKFPRQKLLYVGEPPLRMPAELAGPDLSFRYQTVDIRELDGERLLRSDSVGDNVLAILARIKNQAESVRRILTRIGGLELAEREIALKQLLILAGLRRLEDYVEKEARKMPLLDDIMDNKVLGREYKRGHAEGFQEGELQGELAILRRQMEQRFGPLPTWARERLSLQSAAELEALSVHLLDAKSLEDLLR